MATRYTTVINADHVTPEIRRWAEEVYDGWFASEPRIDWDDFIDRLDGATLANGTVLDLGDSMTSGAIAAIKRHIQKYRSDFP